MVVLEYFGSLWVVVDRCGSLWIVLGSLWIVVGRFGSFWVVPRFSNYQMSNISGMPSYSLVSRVGFHLLSWFSLFLSTFVEVCHEVFDSTMALRNIVYVKILRQLLHFR